jgi:hypothetical protein
MSNRNMSINEAVGRLQALNQFSEETGLPLPYSGRFILAQELQGRTVDLETGEINIIPGDQATFRPTAKGAK